MEASRRSVLRSALGLSTSAALVRKPAQAAPRRTLLLEFAIAGGGYHGLDAELETLFIGQALDLRREPANPHDGMAVAVHRPGGLRLGYVPRAANQSLARLLDDGAHVEARIVGFFDFSLPRAEVERSLLGVASTDIMGGDPRVQAILVA